MVPLTPTNVYDTMHRRCVWLVEALSDLIDQLPIHYTYSIHQSFGIDLGFEKSALFDILDKFFRKKDKILYVYSKWEK